MRKRKTFVSLATFVAVMSVHLTALAEQTKPVDSGATSWMLTSTALELLMIPGLAMFYGGLVRTKNVMGTMMTRSMYLVFTDWEASLVQSSLRSSSVILG